VLLSECYCDGQIAYSAMFHAPFTVPASPFIVQGVQVYKG
jgi:hypothetical protein